MYSFSFWAGVLLLVVGIFLFNDRVALIKGGIVTKATVIEFKYEDHSEGPSGFAPIFRFTTKDKQEITFKYSIAKDPPSWSIGETAKVVYQQNRPHKAVVLTYLGAFGIVVIFVGLALVLLFISGAYYWSNRFFNTLE